MTKYIKAAAIFTSGVVVGVMTVVNRTLKTDYLREALVKHLAENIVDFICGENKNIEIEVKCSENKACEDNDAEKNLNNTEKEE